MTQSIADEHIVPLYEQLMLDKEAEVRSEAIGKLPELSKHCSPQAIVEKILPIIITNTVTDSS